MHFTVSLSIDLPPTASIELRPSSLSSSTLAAKPCAPPCDKPLLPPRHLRLDLTQEEFAATFHIPLGTRHDWERGAREPDTSAKTFLRVIERNPQAVIEA